MFAHRNRKQVSQWQWALALCAALSACDDGGSKSSLSGLGVDDGASQGLTNSKVIDHSKDERLSLDTGAIVDIPAGALSKDTKIGVERPADNKALKLVENFKTPGRIVSAPYVLTPHGTTFKEDVKITLPISKDSTKALSVAWLEDENDKQWKLLGVPKANNGEKATVTLKHFSVLILVEGDEDLAPMEGEDEPELDAGSDDFDAGVDQAPDASAPSVDAQVRNDAALTLDGGPINPQSFYGRLQQCNLIERGGAIQEPPAYGPYEHCFLDCWLKGSCDEVRLFVCGDIDGADAGFGQNLSNCLVACDPGIVTCPDQTTAARCDGLEECPDRSDENNCGDLYFQCDASQRILSAQRCDGFEDCLAGQDEVNCPHHVCSSTGLSLPPDVVCDGVDDCGDGSDEPATCAKLVCARPSGSIEVSPPAQSMPAQTVAADAAVR